VLASAAALTAAIAVAGGAAVWRADAGAPPAPAAAPVQTTTVTRTSLSTTQTLNGTLGYGSPAPVTGSQAGILTWLPASGATVSRGQPLYRVDNRPVPVFYGTTPLYRELGAAGLVGPDVKMVAGNLAALGYDIGPQPAVGSVITQPVTTQPVTTQPVTSQVPATAAPASSASPASSARARASAGATARPAPSVRASPAPSPPSLGGGTAASAVPDEAVGPILLASAAARPVTAADEAVGPILLASAAARPVTATVEPGDAVLTTSLIDAIKLWQSAEGIPPTGTLTIGDVVVQPAAVQVASLQAQVGGPATGPLMSVTPTIKVVTINADSADIPSLRHAATVAITLPDNSTTTGTIASISTAVQSGQATSDGQPQQTVTVSLDHPAAAAGLNSASVQVAFAGQTARGVLAVPVGSLLALSGGGYAVQLPGGRLIPVSTGMFGQGMVAISGPGIVAGLRVVTST
jgi:hypothetical protein